MMDLDNNKSTVPIYGAFPLYQLHFFIAGKSRAPDRLLARTKSRIGGVVKKHVTDVYWEGGMIVQQLNNDARLKELLGKVILEEGEISIDPVENGVRIYGRWKPEYGIKISDEAIEVYDIIAGYVKEYLK